MPTFEERGSSKEGANEINAARGPGRLDVWILPFFQDSALWPVLIVALLSLATFGAAILLVALDTRNKFAIAALALLVWMSGDVAWRDLRRRRRLGPICALILALWLLSGLLALAALRLGLY